MSTKQAKPQCFLNPLCVENNLSFILNSHLESSLSVCLCMCLVEPDKRSGRKCRRKIDDEKIDEERLFNKAIGERIPPVTTSGWRLPS